MHVPLFSETQRFYQTAWCWLVVIVLTLGPLPAVVAILQHDQSMTLVILTLAAAWIPGALVVLGVRMDVRVDDAGLHYRFFPSVFRWKTIAPEEISTISFREKKGMEHLRIGYHYSLFSQSVSLNITGEKMMEVTLRSNRVVTIGTTQASELEYALNRLMQNTTP